MKYKRADRLVQEIDILTNKSISVDYLMNVFEINRQSVLGDLKMLKEKGYRIEKVDVGCYTIRY